MFMEEGAAALHPLQLGEVKKYMAKQGCPGDKDRDRRGTGMGTSESCFPSHSPLTTPLHVQARQSWFCCMKPLPLAFEVFGVYNLVFPDSYLSRIN